MSRTIMPALLCNFFSNIVVDIGITTTSPTLDVAELVAGSDLSLSSQTPLPATSCQLTASSPL